MFNRREPARRLFPEEQPASVCHLGFERPILSVMRGEISTSGVAESGGQTGDRFTRRAADDRRGSLSFSALDLHRNRPIIFLPLNTTEGHLWAPPLPRRKIRPEGTD